MANLNLPERAIRKQIASAITLIVQIERFGDGTRRITKITELIGMEGDVITMQDLFVFDWQGLSTDGRSQVFSATGIRPRFADRLKKLGFNLPVNMFAPTSNRWK